MKARKKSTVCTIALPGGTRTTAASSAAREADQHVGALQRAQAGQRAGQRRRPDLGAAAAAAHARSPSVACCASSASSGSWLGIRRVAATGGHRRELAEPAHEPAIDPVLPAPDPVPLRKQRAARRDRVAVAGADQRQPAALRTIGDERLAEHRSAQVFRQRPAHAHGEHAGLFQRTAGRRRAVAGGEDPRVGLGLQRLADADEAVRVEREAGGAEPGRAACLRDPDDLVGRERLAAARAQGARLDGDDFGVAVHDDAARGQHALERTAHRRVVRRQDRRPPPRTGGTRAGRRRGRARGVRCAAGTASPA